MHIHFRVQIVYINTYTFYDWIKEFIMRKLK